MAIDTNKKYPRATQNKKKGVCVVYTYLFGPFNYFVYIFFSRAL